MLLHLIHSGSTCNSMPMFPFSYGFLTHLDESSSKDSNEQPKAEAVDVDCLYSVYSSDDSNNMLQLARPPSLLELPYRSIHNETRVRRENSEDGQGINRHHETPDGELRHLPIRLCTGTSGIDRRPCCLWLSVPRRVPVYRGDYLYYRRRVQMLAVVCLARYGQEGLAIQIEIGKIKWLTLNFVLVDIVTKGGRVTSNCSMNSDIDCSVIQAYRPCAQGRHGCLFH